MDIVDTPEKGRLRGRALLLSASVPSTERNEIYRQIEVAEAIEEAVVSLARAVFSEGGILVFGGHPTISPLVALVVREYVIPRVAERIHPSERGEHAGPHVEIYQSEAFRGRIAEPTQRLQQQPGVTIHWVPSLPGELADPNVRKRPQAPASLTRMRIEMVQRPDLVGMVCIGGMEGVREEAVLFHEYHPGRPIYALESTGGAAGRIAQDATEGGWIRAPERGVRERVEAFWRHERERSDQGSNFHSERPFAFPYAYIAQRIVAEIIDPDGHGDVRLIAK